VPDQLLHGWGRTAPSYADVVPVGDVAQVERILAGAGPRGVLARGLGRSYGDAAQNAGGTVLDLAQLSAIEVGSDGVVTCGAGARLGDVIDALAPHGLFVPVSPGTSRITLGGAVAADVHGKNHHRDGSFGDHVVSLDVVTPQDGLRQVGPHAAGEDRDLFRATVGGMGLTGVITAVAFRAMPVGSPEVLVDTRRLDSLDAVMDHLSATDASHRYSVAWVDASARGARLGRGVVTQGDHAAASGAEGAVGRPARVRVPLTPPIGAINRLTVAAFNEAWFRRAPRTRTGERQSVRAFFHPLDGVDDWNRVYGPGGLVQHQCALPDSAAHLVPTVLEAIRDAGAPSFLTVLKRFGPGNGSPLSFPIAGWTLAIDVPARVPGLAAVLDGLDEQVAAAGGRVYLAKDSRTRPDLVRAMYPRLPEWADVRRRVDPRGVLASDLSRRLEL
jgi:decaprenylphospho-beta-D-ribofuranose 2-oxidase